MPTEITTRRGLFKEITRTENGVEKTVWVLTEAGAVGRPNFELTNATRADAQSFENVIANTKPGSELSNYLDRQSRPQSNEPKTEETDRTGTYIRVDYQDNGLPGKGAMTVVDTRTRTSDSVGPGLVKDIDSNNPDATITIYRNLKPGTSYIGMSQTEASKYGVRDGQALLELNTIHELLHLANPRNAADNAATTLELAGGHSPFAAVRRRTDGKLRLTKEDLPSDDIEAGTSQEGLSQGQITNKDDYQQKRLDFYQKKLDAAAKKYKIKTPQELDRVLSVLERLARASEEVDRLTYDLNDLGRQDISDDEFATRKDELEKALVIANDEKKAADQAVKDDPIAKNVKLGQLTPDDLELSDRPSFAAAALAYAKEFFAQYAPVIGQEFGSTLGRLLARDESQGVQIASSTLLGTIGLNFGQSVQLALLGGGQSQSYHRRVS